MSGTAMVWAQLGLRPGVICITGSGGKTTLAHCLAAALPGQVIFCTTTRIFPSAVLPVARTVAALRALLPAHRAVCCGTPAASGKLAAPPLPIALLRTMADYVLVEADGAAGLPLKAHLPHEPVIPPEADRVLLVVGASGFGVPITAAAHRPNQFARLAGVPSDLPALPEHAAAVLRQEGGFDTLLINQVCDAVSRAQAVRLAAQLPVPAFAGEFRRGILVQLPGAAATRENLI